MSSLATTGGESDIPSLQVGADGTALDAQHVVTGRGAIVGKSSSGKSNTATVVAEEVLELGIPIAIIDPEGEYVSLKEEYAVVHFGDRPECDVTGGAAEARKLAKRAVRESLPVVLDVSGWEGEQQQEIVGAFASALFQAEVRHEVPLLLFVDEAHTFIPEREKTAASEPLVKVAKRGRKRGLGVCAVSQRPADMKSQFLAQADSLIWHRLSWKNDMGDVRKQLPAEFANDVPRLDTGEAVVDCDYRDGAERLQVRRKYVSDLAATPSIMRSLGTAPETVPADLSDGGGEGEETEDVEVEIEKALIEAEERNEDRARDREDRDCLATIVPDCSQTMDEVANVATVPETVVDELEVGVRDRVTLIKDDGEHYLIGGSADGWTYEVERGERPYIQIERPPLRKMGVTENHELVANVEGDRVRLGVLSP